MFRRQKKETLWKTADVDSGKFKHNEADSLICHVTGYHQQVIIIY